MGMPDFASVEDYLAAQPDDVARVLKIVRSTIRKAIPKAEESVTYKIPTYKLDGVAVIFFAAWKKHWSLYPATTLVTTTCKRGLAPYEVQKGTIKFPYDAKPPATLIAKIAKLRASEVSAKAKPKPKAKAKAKAK
jgi:uncharacterized protein YdhG (YjbR/CyaY superfamily)